MKIHLCGIAGTGMSALAGLLKENGHSVRGSDSDFYPPVDTILENMNIKVIKGYSANNITDDTDLFVIGNVISRGNPEAEKILDSGYEYCSMAEALYRFCIKGKESLVVSGTHGKSSTSSFISFMFRKAGLNPGFFIGAKANDLDSNYCAGMGRYFISEGDEYETSFFDRSSKFLKYHAKYLIISALEYDHADFFKTSDLYEYAFSNLVNQIPSTGFIVLNSDYSMGRSVVKKAMCPVITYGKSEDSDFVIREIKPLSPGYTFVLEYNGTREEFSTQLDGRYNVWNFCAGIITGIRLGLDISVIRDAVSEFSGVKRRLTLINSLDHCDIYEDFAHHPTSVSGVIQSLKDAYPQKKLTVFFEPRSWSLRRNIFQKELEESLSLADEIFIKDVYRKEDIPKDLVLNTELLADNINAKGKSASVTDEFDFMKKEIKCKISDNSAGIILLLSNGSFGGIPEFCKKL